MTPDPTPTQTPTPTPTQTLPEADEVIAVFNFNAGEVFSDTITELGGSSLWTPDWSTVEIEAFGAFGGTHSKDYVPFGEFEGADFWGSFYEANMVPEPPMETVQLPFSPTLKYFVPEDAIVNAAGLATSDYKSISFNNIMDEQFNMFNMNVANFYHNAADAESEWDLGAIESLTTDWSIFTLVYNNVTQKMSTRYFKSNKTFVDGEDAEDASGLMFETMKFRIKFTK